MNKEDDLTQEDIDEYNKRRQKEYEDATNPKDPNTLEEELKKKGPLDEGSSLRQSLSIGTEVGLNTILDLFSFEPGSQIAGGTAINYLAQRIRGGEISQGELVASGLASLIPGGAQGKALTRLAKASGKGAVSGGIQTTSMTAIDEGRLPTAEELGTGLAVGGAFGGLFQAGTELTPALLKNIQNRITKDSVEVFAMGPQRAALGAADDPFKALTPIKQQFGPYPSLPVNARIVDANDIDSAKDAIIANASGKYKTIGPKGKGPLIYNLKDGSNIMFEVDLRGENAILRRDQLVAVPATTVAQDSRKVLESIPEDLEYFISEKFSPEYFEQYKKWVRTGRTRLVDIKKEMQQAIQEIRTAEVEREVRTSYKPGSPQQKKAIASFKKNQRLIKADEAKLEDSHILSIGEKGKLTRTGLTGGVSRALERSKVRSASPMMLKNFPKGSRVYDAPAAYQSFIEYWRLNRARGAGIAFDDVPLQEALDEMRDLGLPTSWLEDFYNFATLDTSIRKELTNKDIIKLLKRGMTAEEITQQRLGKLAREKQQLDISDFAYKIADMSSEDAEKYIDDRYLREILAGGRVADAFLEPPE